MTTFTITTDFCVDIWGDAEVTWGYVTDAEGEYIASVPLPVVVERDERRRHEEWRRLATEAIQAEGFTLVSGWGSEGELKAVVTR